MLYAVINMHACRQYDRRLYILILMVELQVATDHVDFGVKWQILPLCLKGKFYANHAFVHKGKILHQGCRCVHNDRILRHRISRKIPL